MSEAEKEHISVSPEEIRRFIDEEPTSEDLSAHGISASSDDVADASDTDRKQAQAAAESIDIPQPPESKSGNAYEMFVEALKSKQPDVEVTDGERDAFEKAMLISDDPYTATVQMIGGKTKNKFPFTFRTRTMEEFSACYLKVAEEEKQGRIPDYPFMLTRMQEYAIALSLVGMFGREYPSPLLTSSSDFQTLEARRKEKVSGLSHTQYMLLLNAFQIFELKCVKMASEFRYVNF